MSTFCRTNTQSQVRPDPWRRHNRSRQVQPSLGHGAQGGSQPQLPQVPLNIILGSIKQLIYSGQAGRYPGPIGEGEHVQGWTG